MTRGLGLLSIVATLAIGAYLVATQMSSETNSRKQQSQVVDMAQTTAAAATLQQAGSALEQTHALNGTYAGAGLGGFGVTLVRADASSYCVQTTTNGSAFHLAGPGGAPTAGPC